MRPQSLIFGNIFFQFSVRCLCSAGSEHKKISNRNEADEFFLGIFQNESHVGIIEV